MLNPNIFLSAANVVFIACLSAVVGLIFIAIVCMLWWTEIKQRPLKELFKKIKSGFKKFFDLISPTKPVKTVYSDKNKNYSGTEFLPVPTKEPTKEYTYEFMGWNKNFVDENGNTLAKPIFVQRVNTCRINVYGEDEETLLKSEVVEYGAGLDLSNIKLEKPDTKEFSFEFVGWDKDTKHFYKNENVHAVFKAIPKKFTYTFFESDGKTIISQMTAIYGTPILLPPSPAPEDDGQEFSHWKGYADGMLLKQDESFTPVFKKASGVSLKTTIADESMKKQSASSYSYDKAEQNKKQSKSEDQNNNAFFKRPFKIFMGKDNKTEE